MGVSQPVSEAPIPTDRPPMFQPTQSFPHHIHSAIFKIEDQEGVAVAVTPDSTKLPIYRGVIDNRANLETVLDSGATMIYFRDSLAEEMKLEITRIPPRTVLVANHEKVSVNGVVTFDMKLNGLPSE